MKKILIILVFILIQSSYAITLGQTLFEGNCVTCHTLDVDKSAPHIKKVVQTYKKAYPSKKNFVKYMSEWVHTPNINGALMKEDIEKYELMPELGYDKDTLRIIAEYLFETYI